MKIGILGAGQLGRMLALAGYPLGYRFRFLDESPAAPAGHLAELMRGLYTDENVLRQFRDGIDVATYEFENVPIAAVQSLAQHVTVFPPPRSLEVAQDRLVEKTFLRTLGIPTPEYAAVETMEDLNAAVRQIGIPGVLKTRRMGYDGKGQTLIASHTHAIAAHHRMAGQALIYEQYIPFDREVSMISIRSSRAQVAFYSLVENQHREGILRFSQPASMTDEQSGWQDLQREAQEYSTRVMGDLDYAGVLTLEFFVHKNHLLVNEMAPRVHNSGHWTIEGAETSQFENHLRAITGLPLGSTLPSGYCAMMNLIGEIPPIEAILAVPGAHLHLYGKTPRPGRKMGHVTMHATSASDRDSGLSRLRDLIPN